MGRYNLHYPGFRGTGQHFAQAYGSGTDGEADEGGKRDLTKKRRPSKPKGRLSLCIEHQNHNRERGLSAIDHPRSPNHDFCGTVSISTAGGMQPQPRCIRMRDPVFSRPQCVGGCSWTIALFGDDIWYI